MAAERVQKILAAAGYGSRRASEKMIEEGRVKVNGKIIQLGDKADASRDSITVDGKLIRKVIRKIYIALNKPKGYLSGVDLNHPRRTVNDLIGISEPLFAVGRLDLDSEGLMLMTNDGKWPTGSSIQATSTRRNMKSLSSPNQMRSNLPSGAEG